MLAETTDPAVTDKDEARELGKVVGTFLMVLAADVLASAVVRMKEGANADLDLTGLLGVGPLPGVKAAMVARSQLLDGAKFLYAGQIGCCEMCAGEIVKALTGVGEGEEVEVAGARQQVGAAVVQRDARGGPHPQPMRDAERPAHRLRTLRRSPLSFPRRN